MSTTNKHQSQNSASKKECCQAEYALLLTAQEPMPLQLATCVGYVSSLRDELFRGRDQTVINAFTCKHVTLLFTLLRIFLNYSQRHLGKGCFL